MSQESLKSTLQQTIEAISNKPETAKVVFRAETGLVENLRCTAKIRGFEPLTIDEPPTLGGTDAGMNPVELLLAALGTCQEIMYGAYAAVMGVPLDEVKVDVKGYLDLRGLFGMDESVPSGYTGVKYETRIKSAADDETLRTLIKTVESHCPVMDTLKRPIDVTGDVYINGSKA